MTVKLQLALDHENLERALTVAREAVRGGVDRLEAGTPLIKSEGLNSVRTLRREFPSATIVADMKTADAGKLETECAARAGADVIHVLAGASDATISECVESAKKYDARIVVDMLGMEDPELMVKRALEVQAIGVYAVCVHTPIDMQMQGALPFENLKALSRAVKLPVAVAGGINTENAVKAVKAGAEIIIVGGAITKSPDAEKAARTMRKVLASGRPESTEFYARTSGKDIKEVLLKASAADITGAMHNSGAVEGISAIVPGARMAGPALTVWTYPGDWSKPVEAIDEAREGQVLVIDAGGRPPAVWGEMATKSCIQRKIAGVVIDGAIRDVKNVREMGFPAFSRLITPVAGEPRGQGMLDVPLKIGGCNVRSGDWIVGDDDGIVVIPAEKLVETANRAQAVTEQESRQMAEIDAGSTLGKVAELKRWDHVRKGPGNGTSV
ncbi:MAG: 3-hexulose-6-phosphate synthase [Kiritimatiellia bacterium]